MKYRYFLFLLIAPLLAVAATLPEKPNTVLIHPGETLYAQFDESSTPLKLLKVQKEKNDQAQVSLKMTTFDKDTQLLMLTVQSKFTKTLHYKAEMRLLTKNRRQETSLLPLGPGMASYESWPHPIEELALYEFTLNP